MLQQTPSPRRAPIVAPRQALAAWRERIPAGADVEFLAERLQRGQPGQWKSGRLGEGGIEIDKLDDPPTGLTISSRSRPTDQQPKTAQNHIHPPQH